MFHILLGAGTRAAAPTPGARRGQRLLQVAANTAIADALPMLPLRITAASRLSTLSQRVSCISFQSHVYFGRSGIGVAVRQASACVCRYTAVVM